MTDQRLMHIGVAGRSEILTPLSIGRLLFDDFTKRFLHALHAKARGHLRLQIRHADRNTQQGDHAACTSFDHINDVLGRSPVLRRCDGLKTCMDET